MITVDDVIWDVMRDEYGYSILRGGKVVDSINDDDIRIFVDERTLLESYLDGVYDGATAATRPIRQDPPRPAGPRHKRVLQDGQVSRGPARFARAAANAFTNPNSKAGKLYLKRTSISFATSERHPNSVGPFAHMKVSWARGRGLPTDTVNYYTCSLYCASMVVQLDNPRDSSSVDDLEEFLMEDELSPQPQAPTRKVRCYCCGSDIKP